MQVRHELPADDKIPLRVAVRYALYGVVLTKPFDEPVDLDEYRVQARPASPLYGLDEAAGYKKRCALLVKLLEELRDQTLQLNGYTPDLGGKLIYSWSHHGSFRGKCVVNENNSEIFEISEKYIAYIDATIPYYEYDIHYEMKDRYRHWTKLTVERAKFLSFMERKGLIGESRIDVEARSNDVVLTLQERSGDAVERIFTEVRQHTDRLRPPQRSQDALIKAALEAPELKQETGQRKSVQRAKTATKTNSSSYIRMDFRLICLSSKLRTTLRIAVWLFQTLPSVAPWVRWAGGCQALNPVHSRTRTPHWSRQTRQLSQIRHDVLGATVGDILGLIQSSPHTFMCVLSKARPE